MLRERDGAEDGEDMNGGGGWGRRYPGLGNFCVFICLLPLRTSTVGFAEDRLASLML